MDSLLQAIKSGLASSGNVDTDALQKAYNKISELYYNIIEGQGGKAGKKSGETKTITYEGQEYTYYSNYWYYESTAGGCEHAYEQGGKGGNETGIQWNYSYSGNDSDQFYVNIRCVIDLFNKFYQEALNG